MGSLLGDVEELTRNSRVNFFINLEPIFRKMLNKRFNQYLQVKKDDRVIELVSDIINIGAHYRSYFTKSGHYCKVYMYFGDIDDSEYRNKDFIEDYRSYFHERFNRTDSRPLYRLLDKSIELAKSILIYIDGVYLLTPKLAEPSLIPHIIKTEFSQGEINILMTNDIYEYQYVNEGFMILKPNMENSQLITKDNMIERLKLENKIVNKIDISPTYLPYLLSFVGDKYRSITGVRGIGVGKAIKLFSEAINANMLSSEGTTISIVSGILKDEWRELIEKNFSVIDIHTQYNRTNIVEVGHIEKQLVDKFDNLSLKLLNQNYFDEHPLMLMELQSDKTVSKIKKNVFE